MKAETDFGQKNSALRAEAEILISLQGGPGVPDVYWVGKRELAGQKCNILVMELLGPDVSKTQVCRPAPRVASPRDYAYGTDVWKCACADGRLAGDDEQANSVRENGVDACVAND